MASQSPSEARQLTIAETTILYSVTLVLVTALITAVLCWNCLNAAQSDLGQEALKQSDVFDAAMVSLLRSTTPKQVEENDYSAQQKNFKQQQLNGLLIRKSDSRVLFSSFEYDGLKAGQTLTLFDAKTTSALEQMGKMGVATTMENGDVLWFFPKKYTVQGAPVDYYVGIPLRFRNLRSRITSFTVILSGALLLAVAVFTSMIIRLIKREIEQPSSALANVLNNTVAESNLEEISTSLEQLRATWQPHQRHEYAVIFASVEQFLEQLNLLSGQAKAMADDRLQDIHQMNMAFGGLAQEHLRLAEFLDSVAASLDQLAAGNFEINLGQKLKSDGSIGNSFHKMHSSIQFLIERLSQASNKLKTSANKLQESSSTQANAATKQAAGVMTTMATMEELAASSGHIADTAKHVVKIAEETLDNARDGQAAVENVGEGMEEIVKASLKGAERLLNLDEKSRSIGRVATLIAGVSEQSKILALNAAIEAAHAGEAGRGFSVVAEEVRNLAESVFDSTREIEDLINEIQVEIRQAVQASEEEVRRANRGRELATNAQETIVQIYSSAKNMTKAAHQIELATNQQRSASGQVATAVREMAASADDVAKGAKNVRASLDDLGNLADDLQQILAHFDAQNSGSEKVEQPSASS